MRSGVRDPYEKCYVGMRWFHSHLQDKWTNIRLQLSQDHTSPRFLAHSILDFTRHLDGQHRIEEATVFPLLARRLPQFAHDADYEQEHRVMHRRLVDLERYAMRVQADNSVWSKAEATILIDALEGALFPHLEAEEASLRGENLKRAGFTLKEIGSIPL